jgi:hypothetical protein
VFEIEPNNSLISFLLIENMYVVMVYTNKICIYDDEGQKLQTAAKLPPEGNKRGEKL